MRFIIEQMRRARRREDGFTLIELLIVILILGILAGIAVFASGPFRDKATAACQDANTEIGIVANAATDAGVTGDLYAQGPGDCAGTGGSGGTTSTTAAVAAPVIDSVTLGGFGNSLSFFETATATVATSGGAVDTTTYQWAAKNDGSGNSCAGGGWSDISGATGASFTAGVIDFSWGSDYCIRVTVTVTNTAGSDTGTAVEYVG